jgi:hypothetical protein
VHAIPHPPQLASLFVRSTHARLHEARGALHDAVHAPLLQTREAGQRTPQPPQFAGSLAEFTHAPLHAERPLAQAHWPASQTKSEGQALAQAPQWDALVRGSTQL